MKSAQAKPILKRQNPQPQVSKNIKPVSKPKRENSEGKAYKGETQKPAPLKEKASASETDGKDGKTKHVSAGSGGAVGASGTADGKAQTEGSGVGMGKERLSAAAISLRTVTAPIRHWVPAASRTKSFQRQRQGIRGQLVPLASTRSYGCG